jgi:hypothetical protein
VWFDYKTSKSFVIITYMINGRGAPQVMISNPSLSNKWQPITLLVIKHFKLVHNSNELIWNVWIVGCLELELKELNCDVVLIILLTTRLFYFWASTEQRHLVWRQSSLPLPRTFSHVIFGCQPFQGSYLLASWVCGLLLLGIFRRVTHPATARGTLVPFTPRGHPAP